ncbi:MAG: TolC family protein [Desulfobacterales bacterium]
MAYRLIIFMLAAMLVGLSGWTATAFAEPPAGNLPLYRALEKALSANPDIIAFEKKSPGPRLAKRQAGLYPNPKLAFELEGFGGSGPFSGTNNAERTFFLEQEILLGGKIKTRRRVAAEELENIRWEMRMLKQDISNAVKQAYIEVAGAQGAFSLQQEVVELSGRVYEAVRKKSDAGKVSPVESVKAEIELKNNRQALQSLKRGLERKRKALASLWGSDEPDFNRVSENLDKLPILPPFNALELALEENPDIGRFKAERRYRQARCDLAQAQRIPDLSISGGYRQIPESDDTAFIAEVAIPLKIFDRNQGNIEAARQAVKQVQDRRSAVINDRRRQLIAAFQDGLTARDEILALEQEIIPATQQVFAAKKEGYVNGKFPFLELLDAQRVLFDSQERYNDALVAYHLAAAEIERLTGRSIENAPAENQNIMKSVPKQGDKE